MKPWQVAAHCKREAEYHRVMGLFDVVIELVVMYDGPPKSKMPTSITKSTVIN